MSEHFTKNTLECTAYCKKCQRHTQHRVDGGRQGPCIDPDHGKKVTQPGERPYCVIYLEHGERKRKEFADFDESLNFYARFGPELATMWKEKEQVR
jgi:hypothetical protein